MDQQERTAAAERLQSQWDSLAQKVTLDYLYDEIEDLAGRIHDLPHKVADYRKRGYGYSNDWETLAEELGERWPDRQREARKIIRLQRQRITEAADGIDGLCARARNSDSVVNRLEQRLDSLEDRIADAERAVRGAFDTLGAKVQALETEFRKVEYLLDALDDASFDLYPDERGVAACNAVWVSDNQKPKGTLFLTQNRLIFEQREKKALKKVLFITTKSERVQEKLWESPVGALAEIETEDKGVFGKEMLTLHFQEATHDAPRDITMQLKGATNEDWQSLIKRVQSGEVEVDHVSALTSTEGDAATEMSVAAPEEQAPPKEIPTKCPACGANLPPVFKGMQELTCEYCGSKVRL